jgi:ribose 5-phosphate isomerase B
MPPARAVKESVVRIAFGADDQNDTTRAVVDYLAERGDEIVTPEAQAWPEIGAAVGSAVVAGQADLGIVMCWTGTGVSIAANKVPGVRAAVAWEVWGAQRARRWNDANVLALSLKRLSADVAVEVVQAFLDTTEVDRDELDTIARLPD